MLNKNTNHKISIALCSILSISTVSASTSLISQTDSFENNNQNIYWTAFDIGGKTLDIMRLNESDNIAGTNASFDQVNSWLSSNTDWRWASELEMTDISLFFESSSSDFKSFNGDQWSPKTTNNTWNTLIPGVVLDSSDTNHVAWGFNVQESSFGSVSHKHSFNTRSLGGAPLLVRACGDDSILGEVSNAGITIHVSKQGSSCGNGTSIAPFNNLIDAQAAVRTLIASGQNTQGITVLLQAGDYEMTTALSFDSQDSGSASAPVSYKADAGAEVNLIGGVTLDYHDFSSLTDNDVIQTLTDGNASASILQFDLSAAGINDFGVLAPHGWNLEPSDRIPAAMVYSGGEKMALSRWPNVGEVNPYLDNDHAMNGHTGMVSYHSVIEAGPVASGINKFTDDNFNNNGGTFDVAFDRMQYWNNINDIFIDGVVAKSWQWTYNQLKSVDLASKQITLKRGEINGIGSNKGSHFFFENIVEELDQAGEFYIDRDKGLLFVYPGADFANNKITMSVLSQPMISITGAQHLTFDGLTLDTGRNMAIKVKSSQFITIKNSVIRNFSLAGILLNGENNAVSNNEIYNIGGYGVKTEGGTEAKFTKSAGSVVNDTLVTPVSLSAANNSVSHNVIHNFAWDQKSQVPGIWLTGVGNTASYNELYNAPHFAILFRNATDNIASFNYLHDLPYYHLDDGGALYAGTGGSPQMRGNEVINNYFENIPTNGVYLDNFSSGFLVKNNIFNNVGNQNDTFSSININGGGQILMESNFSLNAQRPVKYNNFASNSVFELNQGDHEKMLGVQAAFNAVGLENTPYSKYSSFQLFLDYASSDDFQYQESTVANNLSYNPDISIDIKAMYTGVIQPNDERWVLADNHNINDMTTELNNQYVAFSDIFSVSNNVAHWRDILQSSVTALPTAMTAMRSLLNAVPVDPELINNGDFELSTTDNWSEHNSTAATVFDSVTNSQVLHIFNRTKHSSTAKQTVTGLTAGNTYIVSSKLMTTGTDSNVSMVISYKVLGATKNTTITLGGNNPDILSEGNWVYYNQTFTLPTDFDPSKNFKIWARTTGSTLEDVYADDFSLIDITEEFDLNNSSAASTLSDATTFENDASNDYWTAFNIDGISLDVMRLNISDDLGNTSNVSFDEVNTWLAGNTDWRWARASELTAIATFFESNSSEFHSFNGGVWSPKPATEQWNMLLPGPVLDSQDTAAAWAVNVTPTSIGAMKHKHNFNTAALNGAPLLVRVSL